jgi:hypothetical protein
MYFENLKIFLGYFTFFVISPEKLEIRAFLLFSQNLGYNEFWDSFLSYGLESRNCSILNQFS